MTRPGCVFFFSLQALSFGVLFSRALAHCAKLLRFWAGLVNKSRGTILMLFFFSPSPLLSFPFGF